MIPGRSAFAHAIGHDADAGADLSFALSLLAQSHGSLSSGFGIASHCRCIHAYRMALFANGDGIGPVGFALASRTDGNGVQPNGPGSAPDGQRPFSLCVGIVAQGRSPHGSVSIGSGPYRQGIQSHSAVIEVILVPVTIVRLHTEIMNAVLNGCRVLPGISGPGSTAPKSGHTAQGQKDCPMMGRSLHGTVPYR